MPPNFVKTDIYDEASAVISKAQIKEKSIKSLVYESNSKNIRQLYALVCESLKYATIIEEIIDSTAFLQKVPWMDRNLALVLLYDFLFGKKLAGACSGKYRKAVVKQKKELKAELQKMKEKKGATSSSDLLPSQVKDEVSIPRYIRVNLLKTSIDDVIAAFIEAGYTCVMTRDEAEEEKQDATPKYISNLSVDVSRSLGQYEFAADLHLDDVLVFAARTDFHSHPLYLQGHIILMDKASCFPAYVLSAKPGSHVIDACSAPGNKTSHMASLLRNDAKIYSYDLDPKRISVMNTLLERAGVSAAKTIHQDFLTTDPCSEENMCVEYTIVDPSCSGSGMASRKDYLVDDDMQEDRARLRSLHQLQCRILTHALSFPSVRRVVYSTCSVHREENEDVVRTVLEQSDGFRLVPVMQGTWDRRGLSTSQDGEEDHIGECCVRASPHTDLTNGFFVALFERTGKSGTGVSKRQVPEDTINGHGQSLDEKHSKKKKKAKVGKEETVESQEEALKADVVEDDQKDKNERKKKKKRRKENEMNVDVCASDEISDDVKQIKKKHKKSKNESEESDELVMDKCGKKEKKKKGSKRKSSENSDSAPLVTDQANESQPSAKKKKKTKKIDM
ncbi:probable 28S rRNA (cytosine-C(5))-methyltransferase [Strongylocentrotus purpuratus]|uniref:SAM-dependent MTase RsmB/NOP-type domain-containing protein n=1 Tax=Strongylocentrotus purpuratus TaxID=7668 RepID=A0A7M7NY74_STRPU|nr:probable 28S rRNA (cytosine-C(5))-methyltransferase [Strongylocentrotus purpuratus]